jgi:hypothetical protein
MTRIDPGNLYAGPATFIFSVLLGGWVYRYGGLLQCIPHEAIIEYCNRTNTNCWMNWPIATKGQYITDVTNFYADATTGLKPSLKFGCEVGNEMWNFGQSPWGRAQTLGFCLGFTAGGNNPNYSYTGLRIRQYAPLAAAAWTGKDRSRGNLYIMNQMWVLESSVNGNADTAQLKGGSLNASTNTIYAAYGGLGGGSAPSYNAFPDRPIDVSDNIGYAPYWGSRWWTDDASRVTGTVSDNALWLQASKNYTSGSTASAYQEMADELSGVVTKPFTGSAGGFNVNDYKAAYANFEKLCAQYDGQRAGAGLRKLAVLEYEAGPQFGLGSDVNNGTNGTASSDILPLATRITALGWDVSPYTLSGTNNATEVATQTINLLYNFKFSVQYKTLFKLRYTQMVTAHAGREAMPAQYGYAGGQWAIWPVSYSSGKPYSSYDAIHEFNNFI